MISETSLSDIRPHIKTEAKPFDLKFAEYFRIDFQKINVTRLCPEPAAGKQGGDHTNAISPTDDAVRLFFWKSVKERQECAVEIVLREIGAGNLNILKQLLKLGVF